MSAENSESGGPRNFDLTHEHARIGYQNAQEAIRFVDAKTSIMTGLVIVTTGVPFLVLQWLLNKDNSASAALFTWLRQAKLLVPVEEGILLFMIAGVTLGCLSLICLGSGAMARRPFEKTRKGKALTGPLLLVALRDLGLFRGDPKSFALTCLFPIAPRQRIDEARKLFAELSKVGLTQKEVINEYATQLHSVGVILDRKMAFNRAAIWFFHLQLALYICGAVTAAIFLWFFIGA